MVTDRTVITMEQSAGSALVRLAVITLLSSVHVWRICSAGVLPHELLVKGLLPLMIHHFCPSNDSYLADESICGIFHGTHNSQYYCNNIKECKICEEENQHPVCTYDDALVCKYNDDRGSCIYFNSSSIAPFCFCRYGNGSYPTWIPPEYSLRSNCTLRNLTSTQAIVYPSSQACQTTTSHPSTRTKSGLPSTTLNPDIAGQASVVAIVVGPAVSFIVLLVILVMIFLCRRRKLKAVKKKTSNQGDECASVEMGRRASNRAQLPEPLVINNLEYSYAYDHWPVRQDNATTVDPTPVTRAGAQVGGQGSVRYVTDGPGSSSTETWPTTEAADVHPSFSPGRRGGYEEVEIEHDEGSATEVAHSSPGQSLTEEDDHAYFQVYPTRESQRSHNRETPGYEEVSVTGTDVQANAASSPYQQLNRATMESPVYKGLKDKADDDLTGEENVSSPYQHLNRATLKRFNEGDRQKGNDDYEHLKGKDDYDVIWPDRVKSTVE